MALGVLVVALGGLIMGGGIWPMKLMRLYQFEHWWFIAMLLGLIVVPWTITLAVFPHSLQAFREVPLSALVISNLCSISWGIANVLCVLCFLRIGVALTQAILTGLGVSAASILPLIFKGSGLFKDAPSLASPAGLAILCGIGVMLIGVGFASLAGFGRDRELKKLENTSGSFLVGLIMTIIAGVMSAGLMLAFVYSQGPIVARVSTVEIGATIGVTVKAAAHQEVEYAVAVDKDGAILLKGKEDIGPIKVAGLTAKAAGDTIARKLGITQSEAGTKVTVDARNILAILPVQAVGLLGGALVNVLYPVFLMTRRKTWGVLAKSWKECGLAVVMALELCVAVALANKGMLLLGAVGASVGAGIQQAMQMVGGQGLGFISGEWKGVYGQPRRQMYAAIGFLLVAAVIMAYSKTLK
jgi:L-rhamnose-proton symport protein (RhaT)